MIMKISKVAQLLNAQVICGEELLDNEVETACGADMMSDVLAFVKDRALLLTGLVNPQVVRTAEMMDIRCIAFVRGKQPNDMIIELAKELSIVLLTTEERWYAACGILYSAGLNPDGGIKS